MPERHGHGARSQRRPGPPLPGPPPPRLKHPHPDAPMSARSGSTDQGTHSQHRHTEVLRTQAAAEMKLIRQGKSEANPGRGAPDIRQAESPSRWTPAPRDPPLAGRASAVTFTSRVHYGGAAARQALAGLRSWSILTIMRCRYFRAFAGRSGAASAPGIAAFRQADHKEGARSVLPFGLRPQHHRSPAASISPSRLPEDFGRIASIPPHATITNHVTSP